MAELGRAEQGIPVCLTIAGSDPSGGAGIQADLKAFAAHKVYGMSVLTALTAQNTVGVQEVLVLEPGFVAAQLQSVFEDIKPDAVKIGMLGNGAVIRVVAEALNKYHPPIVILDPVMVASSGDLLIDMDALEALTTELFPLATLLTPNKMETAQLSGFRIDSLADLRQACVELNRRYAGIPILAKGGDLDITSADSSDILVLSAEVWHMLSAPRVITGNTHGTGCTLSAAIAAQMAMGKPLLEAVTLAKSYVTEALLAGKELKLGHGKGPLWHNFA
jgi:hydroxymethylpyrimidine/phosphomethylpyrimidine kinase